MVAGFNRSFGIVTDDERYEFLKPIMFTAGVGVLDDRHKVKGEPEEGKFIANDNNTDIKIHCIFRHDRVQSWGTRLPHRNGRRSSF